MSNFLKNIFCQLLFAILVVVINYLMINWWICIDMEI
jgi:hypothetical protein